MKKRITFQNKTYVSKLIDEKYFVGYTGVNLTRVNAYLSSLSSNLSGKPISKDKWADKLEVIKTEVYGSYRLYEHMFYLIPLHIKDLHDMIMYTAMIKLNIEEGSRDYQQMSKFYFRVLSNCGSKVLEFYFFTLNRWLHSGGRHTVKEFMTYIPLQGFFDVVFIKLLSVEYRKKWGIHSNIVKIIPMPQARTAYDPHMESLDSQMSSIAHRLSNIIISKFNDKSIGLSIGSDVVDALEALGFKLIGSNEEIVINNILLNNPSIPMYDLFNTLDKTIIFNTKEV